MTQYQKEKLLEWIESKQGFSCEESENQTKTFSRRHTRFDIVIAYKGRRLKFDYQCNLGYCEPNKKDCLYAILSDSWAYEDYDDIDDFQGAFGYEKASECLRAYNGCKKAYQKVHYVFTDDELSVLNEHFQDYQE